MTGRALGLATSQSVGETINIPYTATTVTQAVYIATQPMLVTGIAGRQRVNGGSGATIKFYKAPSGTAAASGTQLDSGAGFDASSGGTADANQTIGLSTVGGALQLAVGDSVNIVVSGTMTSAVGVVQVFVEPLT